MPKPPEIHPEFFKPRKEIPFKRKVTQRGHFLTIELEPPEAEIKEITREKSEEEKIFENVMAYIENPEKRSEVWEKLYDHSKKIMGSYMDITPEGPKPVDGKKETLGIYIEQHVMENFPESAAAILKAAWEKFGDNSHMIVTPTAKEPDVPVSKEAMKTLQICDNILFINDQSKQRIVKELWHLLFRIPESVKRELKQKGWDEEEIAKRASMITFGMSPVEEGFPDKYLQHLVRGRARIGFLAGFKTAEKLLTPGFEAEPQEIEKRLEIMEKYFQNARQVHYYSPDRGTDLIIDTEDCPLSKIGAVTKEVPFGAFPSTAHFCCNPNSVEGRFRINLHVGKLKYSTAKFPDLKEHPIQVELKQGKITNIEGLDEESEKVAGPLRELYERLSQKEKASGGDPNQVYQVVEFGFQLNPELTNAFESQTPEEQIRGGDFRVCETCPHLGTAGSYGMPDSKGNLKNLKGTTVHIDLIADYFTEGMNMEIEYKDGSKKQIMKDGKWAIF